MYTIRTRPCGQVGPVLISFHQGRSKYRRIKKATIGRLKYSESGLQGSAIALYLERGSDRSELATNTPTGVDDLATALGLHAGTKATLTDLLDAADATGIVNCHDSSPDATREDFSRGPKQ